MSIILGTIALLLNIIGYAPYIRGILKRKVKPHRISWGVWPILSVIAAYNQIENGGGYSTLFFLSSAILVVIVFLLSLRYGVGGAGKTDLICLFSAMFLLTYWLIIPETQISTILAVTIDTIAGLPTIIKTYRNPATESYSQWSFAAVAGIFTMLAVPRFDMILLLYPLYIILMNMAVITVKYIRDQNPQFAFLPVKQ